MASPSVLVAYVAFNEPDAKLVEAGGELGIKHFAPCRWMVIRSSIEWAVESALKSKTNQAVRAAQELTHWIVLQVTMPAEKVAALFLAGALSRSPDNQGFRLRSTVHFSEVSIQWLSCSLPPLGLETWAAKFLFRNEAKSSAEVPCAGCQTVSESLWSSSSDFGKKPYCAKCWNVYFCTVSRNSILESNSCPNSGRDGQWLATGVRMEGDIARAASIFSGGKLLDAVQRAKLFKDSKHFVDMPLKHDPEIVRAAFEALPDKTDPAALQAFVAEHFAEPGSELEPWVPTDYQEQPSLLGSISDPERKAWALQLNKLWTVLGRKTSMTVADNQSRFSSIAQRFPTIVPGGRFRETYYWDTYWIIRGLIMCDMVSTAKGIVENLLDSVRRFGFVPNGTRVYYLDRSQPPLLTDMVMAIYAETGDQAWLQQVLPVLEVEYNFWMDPGSGRVVELDAEGAAGDKHRLNVYRSMRDGPRPESYCEDLATAAEGQKLGRKPFQVHRALCSAAESGWDFSTRWLQDAEGGESLGQADLATIATVQVVPADLNCYLYRVETGLASAYEMSGAAAGSRFRAAAARRAEAMNKYLWTGNSYRDYLRKSKKPSAVVSVSDWAAPLWAGLQGPSGNPEAMVQALEESGLLSVGGAATTAVDTGGKTQWDSPNAWPPLQLMLIEGLEKNPCGKALGKRLAEEWLSSNERSWLQSGHMSEKYDAFRPGNTGRGGEYEPQVGFGWSNGVALVLLGKTAERGEKRRKLCEEPHA